MPDLFLTNLVKHFPVSKGRELDANGLILSRKGIRRALFSVTLSARFGTEMSFDSNNTYVVPLSKTQILTHEDRKGVF